MKPALNKVYLLSALLLVSGICCAQSKIINNQNKEFEMPDNQKNKEVIRKLYEEALNKRNLALLANYIAADYTGFKGIKGAAGFETPVAAHINAFPDIIWTIEDLIAEGDRVAVRWTWKGTHQKKFADYPATGKTITNDGMAIYKLKSGKVINVNMQVDRLGFLQALDIVPQNPAILLKNNIPGAVFFIDKFFVPANAKKDFYERMNTNRAFIKTLHGFMGDDIYSYTDDKNNLTCITIARWENIEALNNTKAAVQEMYKSEGFNPAEMFERLQISIDRGIYTKTD